MRFFHTVTAVAAAVAATVSALPKVTRQGRYLYQEDGTRFYIKGISYQEQGTVTTSDPSGFPEPTDYYDPLADAAGCQRDIPFLKQLGVNAIRVYSVNSALNHDACMSALSSAGIYTIIDLALPVNGSIDRASPAWTVNLLNLYVGTVDAFLKYDNVLAFNVGNEVVTGTPDTVAAPFIKAAARDVKAYLKSKGSSILVGFSSTDGSTWVFPLAEYLACGADTTAIDIFGINVYRWCGNGDISNYNTLLSTFQNYPIPAYFSEFGCVDSPPRLWTEVAALFGSQMTPIFSGGLAFSYFPAVGGYGMVTISADGSSVTTSDDFNRLQQQYSQVSFINTPSRTEAGSNSQPNCPAQDTNFLASTNLPDTPTSQSCDCLNANAFSCVFSNTASNGTSLIVGDLLNYGCSQLGQLGSTCDPIGANGATGTYGAFSECDPNTKLSYVLTQYYELTNRNSASCSFAGNATIVSTGPANAQAANSAASSCATAGPTGTVVPTAPATSARGNNAGTTQTAGGNGNSNQNNAAMSTLGDSKVVSAVLALTVSAVAGGFWVLL
ncbi:1,3-beta-glucanosyltransferase gas1 [Tulasnella sp. 419]|nr:1,3-beta-glucanosyltransferase gas1 [Tulasnella sp. 418]KAG8968625.1 1,3-beta-glucanosyltransferase gas1 [Tulasnella sp. 419]